MLAVPAAANANDGQRVSFAVIGLLVVGLVIVGMRRSRQRTQHAPRSQRLKEAAAGWLMGSIGLLILSLSVWDGQQPVPRFFAYLLYGALPLGVAAVLYAVLEGREQRRLRADLGLSGLRRRLHWGWAVGAWVVLSFIAYFLVLVALFLAGIIDNDSGISSGFSVAFLVWLYGGAAVAGIAQAWRRRIRDRQIEDADLEAVGLVRDSGNQAPAWMPTFLGRAWTRCRRDHGQAR